MYNKLAKKCGLTLEETANSTMFYNEYGQSVYIDNSSSYLERIKNIYFRCESTKSEKLFYDYLIYQKHKLNNFNFCILKSSDLPTVKKFINDVIGEVILLEYDNYLILLYQNELDIPPLTLKGILNEDYYIDVEVFEGFKIESCSSLLLVFSYYRYYLSSLNKSNLRDLIFALSSKNTKDLRELKPIVMKKLNNDSQIEKLINGMFDNNLNVSKTSQEVYMHRNTINNKLNLIKEETSLDVQNFKDAMAMYLLLNAR